MMIHLFREAKKTGLVGEDTVWILTYSVTNFMDSVNTSVIYSVEGSLGVKIHYSESSSAYKSFCSQFWRTFRTEYPQEDNFEPGFYALKAYDSIETIIKALNLEKISGNNSSSPKMLLNNILLSNFDCLSGQIRIEGGELKGSSKMRIVNVVGKKYKEIDFWLLGFGFSRNGSENGSGVAMGLKGPMNWPGDLNWTPKGWVMPSNAKPLKIGVTGRTSFEKFVKVVNACEQRYEGSCIELFYKTYDAAVVGDVTIIMERYDKLEFTQPYAESGLSMIVPVKSDKSAWMFMEPFTWHMRAVTGAILIYTMFIVWFLEHQSNPEFRGPLKNQIGTAVMFTFSSLFFAHREKIYSNLTRVVLIVWLFVVLILNSSYTANLTSMLTIQRLQPNLTDINWLRNNNLPIGCDGDSFVRDYLENVLKFKPENIKNVSSEYDYPGKFQRKNIYAAFLELPYEKVFLSHYCKQYLATTPTYRFGGLGFAFQKGSPIAADVSKAILKLSENGELTELEKKWLAVSPECSSDAATTNTETERLSLKNFWVLYVISGATSTFCVILFLVQLLKKYWHFLNEEQGNTKSSDGSVWTKTVDLARYIYHGQDGIPGRSSSFSQSTDVHEWFESDSDSAIPDSHVASSPSETQLVNISNTSGEYSERQ